jgi:hypothetical protein
VGLVADKLYPWAPDDFDPDPIAEADFVPFAALREQMSDEQRVWIAQRRRERQAGARG